MSIYTTLGTPQVQRNTQSCVDTYAIGAQIEILVIHVNGGTWKLSDDMLGFALGTMRVKHNNDFSEAISPAASFNTGVLWINLLGNLSLVKNPT